MSQQRTYPIALAHGIARFDFLRESFRLKSQKLFGNVFDEILLHLARHGIKVPTDSLHYFRGILTALEDEGFDAHHTRVSFARSLETRARDLKDQIDGIINATGARKVHVIAHSMGGLDTRFMIAKLGMADRVASLTTIGTPHLGTSLADHKLNERGGSELIELLSRAIDLRGFENLTRAACQQFNESVRNAEATNEVFYQTYASAEERRMVFTFLQLAWDVINQAEGENDGLVSIRSQAWQPELTADDGTSKRIEQKRFPVPADHLNEVGWWDLNEINGKGPLHRLGAREHYESAVRQVYLGIARDLAGRFPAAA
ncbi:MAG: esterase/lipase family protein [Pyrinomonadaceae bacterium]